MLSISGYIFSQSTLDIALGSLWNGSDCDCDGYAGSQGIDLLFLGTSLGNDTIEVWAFNKSGDSTFLPPAVTVPSGFNPSLIIFAEGTERSTVILKVKKRGSYQSLDDVYIFSDI